MTAALLDRASHAARKETEVLRADLVGAAMAWAQALDGGDWHRYAWASSLLRAIVRRYEKASERWLRLASAHAKRARPLRAVH